MEEHSTLCKGHRVSLECPAKNKKVEGWGRGVPPPVGSSRCKSTRHPKPAHRHTLYHPRKEPRPLQTCPLPLLPAETPLGAPDPRLPLTPCQAPHTLRLPFPPPPEAAGQALAPLRQTGPGPRSRQPLRLPGPHRHSDRPPPPPPPPNPAPAALRILPQPQLVALERRLRALRSLHGYTREPEEKQDPGLRRASPPPLPRRQPPRPGGHDGNRRCRQLTRRPRGGAGPAARGRPPCLPGGAGWGPGEVFVGC